MIPCCADCRHFERAAPPARGSAPRQQCGECHARPPKCGVFDARAKWPQVQTTDWCGLFEAPHET